MDLVSKHSHSIVSAVVTLIATYIGVGMYAGHKGLSELTTKEDGSYYTYYNADGTLDMIKEQKIDNLATYNQWKADRQEAVDSIEVTYNSVVYQGDEKSQDRMSRAINALPDDTTTIPCVAKDNTIHQLTIVDLKAILLDAGHQQAILWNEGRPV